MNKRVLFLFFALVLLAMASTSCVTPKKVRYLQDMPVEGLPFNESLEATVAPFDELRIFVLSNTGKDDELIKPFNVLGTQTNNLNQGIGYLVDANGNIQFPVLGELHIEGLTRLQVQDTIASRLHQDGYIKNPLVTVRFMNFKIYFLSTSGGRVLSINEERCTLLEALAMSGGLGWYTRRDRVGVMREVDGKRVVHYLDPRSTEVFKDEFFLLKQNDIIFTEETNYVFVKENLTSWMVLVSSVTSLASLVTLFMTIKALVQK